MENDNYTVKKWLLRVGTVKRRNILRKLKTKLMEEHGLTKQEVYRGLCQLVMKRPQVLLTKSIIADYSHYRSHVKEETVECEESSSKKSIQQNTAELGEEKLPAALEADKSSNDSDSTQAATASEKNEISLAEKTTIPELLDENVGNVISPIITKVRRTSIALHLNSHGPTDAKKDREQIRAAPEIRIADSSVPDEEASVLPEKCVYKQDRSVDKCATKRPRIIEDVTCIEGTLLDISSLTNIKELESCPAKKQKRTGIVKEMLPNLKENVFEDKSENTNIELSKKSRIRKKFREIFGKTLTHSEIEEENELMAESIPKKRRKESRVSLDSGVCLSEIASEQVLTSPDIDFCEKEVESVENRLSAVNNETRTIERSEKSCGSDPLVRSMPLLDSLENIDDTISNTLPDSSTNFDDKPETNVEGGKFKDLITPIDTHGFGSFTPMSLEFDITSGSHVSTTTTEIRNEENSTTSDKKRECYDDLSKLLEIDLKKDFHITQQGNTISIQDESDSRVSPLEAVTTEKDVEIESQVTDNATIIAESQAVSCETKCTTNVENTANSHDTTLNCKDINEKTVSSAMESCLDDKNINSKHQILNPSATEICDNDKVVESQNSDEKTIASAKETQCKDDSLNLEESNQRIISSDTDSCTEDDQLNLQNSEQGIQSSVTEICNKDDKLNPQDSEQRTKSSVTETCNKDDKLTLQKTEQRTKSSVTEICNKDDKLNPLDSDQITESSVTEMCNKDDQLNFQSLEDRPILSVTETCENADKTNLQESIQIPSDAKTSHNIDIDSNSQSKNVDSTEKMKELAINQELPNPEELGIKIESPEVEELAVNEEEQQTIVDEILAAQNSTEIEIPKIVSPSTVENTDENIPSNSIPSSSMPKLRVLHHSELGSRWCPTPVVSNVSSNIIVESQQPVPTISALPAYHQIARNTQHPYQDNQFRYFNLLDANAMPVINTNTRDFNSKETPNVYNIPQTQKANLPTDYSVNRGTNINQNTPSPPNYSSIATNYSVSTNKNVISPPDQKIIFNYLLRLQWCFECSQCTPIGYDPKTLRTDFFMIKALLLDQLTKCFEWCQTMIDLYSVIKYIIQYYAPLLTPGKKMLTVESFIYLIKLKKFPVQFYGTLGQTQNATISSAANGNASTSRQSQIPQNLPSYSSHVRCYAAASQPELTRTFQAPILPTYAAACAKSTPSQTRFSLSPEQMEILNRQIEAYNSLNRSLHQQLNALIHRQQLERQRILREQSKDILLKEKFNRMMNRGIDQRQMPTVPTTLNENMTNKKMPELRQSPIASLQQEFGTNQNIPSNNAQRQNSPAMTQHILPQYPISGGYQAKHSATMQNVNSQERRQSPSNLTQKCTSTDPKRYVRAPICPVSVQNSNLQQQMRQSPTTSSQICRSQDPKNCSITSNNQVQMEIGAQLELRKSPSDKNQQNQPQKKTVSKNRKKKTAAIDKQRQSSDASTEKSIPHTQPSPLRSTPEQMDNNVDQHETRQSPAATTSQSLFEDILRSYCRILPVSMNNVDPQLEMRQSPAAEIPQSLSQELVRSNQRSVAVSETQIRQQQSPVALIQQSSPSEAIRNNQRNSLVSDEQLGMQQSPAAPNQQILPQELIGINQRNKVFDAQCELRQSPPAPNQQTFPQEPIGIDERNKVSDAQRDLRQNPAVPIHEISSNESTLCDNSTILSAEMNNNAQVELQKSPVSIQQNLPKDVIVHINLTNIAATSDNPEAQLEFQPNPPAQVQQTTTHERNNEKNPFSMEKILNPNALFEKVTVDKPVNCDNSTNIATSNKDNMEELARAQLELRQSPVTHIQEEAASSNSKSSEALSRNECNVRVLDVLEEFDALSSNNDERSSASPCLAAVPKTNSTSTETPQTESLTLVLPHTESPQIANTQIESLAIELTHSESLPLAQTVILIDSIVTSDDKDKTEIEESDEENDDYTLHQSDVESIASVASPVPVVTINDDDDDDDFNLRLIAAEIEEENKKEMLLEVTEIACEAEKEIVDSTDEISEAPEERTDETTEFFSILDVKSISKDVFNNIGNCGESVAATSSRIQEPPVDIDVLDIRYCSRCGKPSSVVCEQCFSAYYCSDECHRTHWTEIHHLSCKPVPEEEALAKL